MNIDHRGLIIAFVFFPCFFIHNSTLQKTSSCHRISPAIIRSLLNKETNLQVDVLIALIIDYLIPKAYPFPQQASEVSPWNFKENPEEESTIYLDTLPPFSLTTAPPPKLYDLSRRSPSPFNTQGAFVTLSGTVTYWSLRPQRPCLTIERKPFTDQHSTIYTNTHFILRPQEEGFIIPVVTSDTHFIVVTRALSDHFKPGVGRRWFATFSLYCCDNQAVIATGTLDLKDPRFTDPDIEKNSYTGIISHTVAPPYYEKNKCFYPAHHRLYAFFNDDHTTLTIGWPQETLFNIKNKTLRAQHIIPRNNCGKVWPNLSRGGVFLDISSEEAIPTSILYYGAPAAKEKRKAVTIYGPWHLSGQGPDSTYKAIFGDSSCGSSEQLFVIRNIWVENASLWCSLPENGATRVAVKKPNCAYTDTLEAAVEAISYNGNYLLFRLVGKGKKGEFVLLDRLAPWTRKEMQQITNQHAALQPSHQRVSKLVSQGLKAFPCLTVCTVVAAGIACYRAYNNSSNTHCFKRA